MLDGKCGEFFCKNGIVNNSKGVHESAKSSVMSQSTVYDVNSMHNSHEQNGTIDFMAAVMEMSVTMEILCSTNVCVCV